MPTTRSQLGDLIRQSRIPADHLARASQVAGLYPAASDWRRFFDQSLIWLASLALAFSLLFFIAYNWTAWGRLARFALVEAALAACLVGYWFCAGRPLLAQASLVAASLVLGVLLALFGQVYQTGADPWQLFFNWALLMLPWTLVARLPALWLLWLGLLNLAAVAYFDVWGPVIPWGGLDGQRLLWQVFTLNTVCLLVWELAATRWTWLAVNWARRLIALGVGIPVTQVAFWIVLGGYGGETTGSLFIYLVWLVLWLGVYRWLKPDLFMLAGACLSAIVVVLAWLAEPLIERGEALGMLLLALMLIGSGALAAGWLKRVNRKLRS